MVSNGSPAIPWTRERVLEAFSKAQSTYKPGKVDFRRANFTGLDLHGIDFHDANVTDAVFKDAILKEADLSQVKGIVSAHLTGADLTLCKLPEEIAKFPMLEQVKELSKNAGAIYLTTIIASAFLLLTTYSTRDIQLLTNQGTAKLPVIGIELATGAFFGFAPVVVLSLFIVFHLYLDRLWAMMAQLPAVFPDGAQVTQRTYPWLVNDFFAMGLPRAHKFRIQWLTTLVACYAAVPAVLGAVFVRCLVQRDEALAWWQWALFVGGTVWAARSLYRLQTIIRRRPSQGLSVCGERRWGWRVLRWGAISGIVGLWGWAILRQAMSGMPSHTSPNQSEIIKLWTPATPIGNGSNSELLGFWPKEALKRIDSIRNLRLGDKTKLEDDYQFRRILSEARVEITAVSKFLTSDRKKSQVWELLMPVVIPQIEEDRALKLGEIGDLNDLFVSYSPEELAYLKKREIDQFWTSRGRPDSRTGKSALERMELARKRVSDSTPLAMFVSPGTGELNSSAKQVIRYTANLQWFRARGATLTMADFRGANLLGADFADLDLRGVKWIDGTQTEKIPCNLTLADFSRASMRGAQLRLATMIGAKLYLTDLSGADLSGARLTCADFYGAKLFGATFQNAILICTSFVEANLTGALFYTADAHCSNFTKATLIGANLSMAKLIGSSFIEANLTGADLSGTYLNGADFGFAKMTNADISGASCWGADFNYAMMDGAEISGTDLRGARNIESASFDRAIYAKQNPPAWPTGVWNGRAKVLNVKGRILREVEFSGRSKFGESQAYIRLELVPDPSPAKSSLPALMHGEGASNSE